MTESDIDGVAAAKAKLIEVAGQFDPMEPVRRHPYITAMAVLAGISVLSVSAERLAGAASFAKWVSNLVKGAHNLIQRFAPAPTQPQTHS
ncbi:MAG TPA: hypothetical protein VL992_13765 [Tepidisphaeraceae bacterium]|nr:hypothetical protein [Tepidisphaeraceae bacterium]